MNLDVSTAIAAILAIGVGGYLLTGATPSIREVLTKVAPAVLFVAWAVLLVLIAVVIVSFASCRSGAHAQDRDRTIEDHKLTALMAARVVANETAIALQCVPWERREGCVNDLGMVIQRTRNMAKGRTLYEELRRHSPRATGRCLELAEQGVPRAEWPRRCRSAPTGNVRWSPGLRMDGREPIAWRDVVALPWSAREQRWVRLLRDAGRLLMLDWEPCETAPETWGGIGDTPSPGLVAIDCGNSRNTPYARRVAGGTIAATVARGD